MAIVKRFDIGGISSVERTPQGFLRIPIHATRVGVFTYKQGDGTVIKEFRSPEEVFKADSLASLADAPITLLHPPEMVTPQNIGKYQKGYATGTPKADGELVATVGIVSHADAIEAVDKGMREVSCGYRADVVPQKGEYHGEHYDYVQRDIVYNHIAIVPKGRGGPDVRLRLDAADAVIELNPPQLKETAMKIKINGREFEVTQEIADAYNAEMKARTDAETVGKARMDSLVADVAKADAAKDAAKSELTAAQAKLDAATAELAKRTDSIDQTKLAAAVKVRKNLEKVAAFLLKKEQLDKLDSMSDLEIRKAVIMADAPTANLEGKENLYIDVRFDSVAERVQSRKDFNTAVGAAIAGGARKDADITDAAGDARKAYLEKSREAYKTPLASAAK